jgi:uncharacterized protein with ParB-like and HNH nuclease domain
MQTSPVRLIEYFEGRKQNLIPLFQRPYRWTKDNWERLWKDLDESDSDSPHFTGAIVSLPVRTTPIGVNKHLIIDGQQRLTTVAILIAALRPFLEGKIRERTTEYLLNRLDEGADYYKLLPTQADRIAFQMIVDEGQHDSQSLMTAAYDYFHDQIKNSVDGEDPFNPHELLTKIEYALKVVMINLDDKTEDPYEIFESLNATGTPLTAADLIRNFILMHFKHSIGEHGDQERIYKNLWLPIEANCGDGDSLQLFFMHYCRTDGSEVQKKAVYKAFKDKLDGKSAIEVEKLLAEVKAYSAIYPRLLRPQVEANENVRKPLEGLNSLGVSVYYPLLLRLFKSLEDGKIGLSELQGSLELIESFAIRRAVCNVKNNALDGFLAKIVAGLPDQNVMSYLENALASGVKNLRWPNDADFTDNFCNVSQYGRSATSHILWSLEESFEHKEEIQRNGVSIEHILPQTLTPEWSEDLVGVDLVQIDASKDRFGNLTLTGYNPELSNRRFIEKKKLYVESHFELNKEIAKVEFWTPSAIQKRGEELAKRAILIWKRPAPPPLTVI